MLWIQETFVNKTENHGIGESEVYETCFDNGQRGDLYRDLQSMYGRCTGKVYIGQDSPSAIGWVFEGRSRYEDSPDTYLREVWVTLHERKETRTVEYHYAKERAA